MIRNAWPKICLSFSLTLLLAAVEGAEARLFLVRDGVSTYSISLPQSATPAERRGADELQHFIFEMSGARLPIATNAGSSSAGRIFVGTLATLKSQGIEPSGALPGPEGFRLQTTGHDLIIAGGGPRGALYGVYAFLESLGCRWFTRDIARIPTRRTIAIGAMNRIEEPAFEYREPFFTEAFDKAWAARNKINGARMELDASTGGKIEYFPFVHSFYSMLPPDAYFKDHPEYYSLIEGKRRVDRGQLCLTNPEVLRLSVEVVLRWVKEHPEATLYSVSQNDWEGWCECDRCRKVEEEEGGAHSGVILRFVNAVAAEVEKKYPSKLIDTLAYWYSEAPPLRVRPRPNVRIRLCPINACEAHPYEQCPHNGEFMRNLKGWAAITHQLYIWHYVTNFSHYLLPFPDFDEIAADIPMYRRNGVVGIFLEGAYPKGGGGENAELRSYVMARLLWNPAADMDAAINEFLIGVYGRSAPFMRDYFDLLHKQVRMPPRGAGQHIWIRKSPDLSETVLQRAKDLFRKAESAAGDPAVRARVRKARFPLDYYELMRDRTYASRDGIYAPARSERLENRYREFYAALRSFGITSIHEGVELERDEQQLANSIRPHPLEMLATPTLRVDLVPELNARIIRMVDKRTGADLVRSSDFGGLSSGFSIGLYSEVSGRTVIDATWTVDSKPDPGTLVLRGAAAGGLKLRKILRLSRDTPTLQIETVVENSGVVAAQLALQARFDVNPGPEPNARVTLVYRDLNGATVEKSLLEPGTYSSGNESYREQLLPDGEWRVIHRGLGVTLVNRFSKGEVERCVANWRARGENRVGLSVWSRQISLEPGKSFRFATEFEITRLMVR